jgi:predicted DNA-binding transcriptional regulator AlpA
MRKTPPSEPPATLEANQALAAKSLARGEHNDRSVRAAGAPPARLGVHLLSKRQVLVIANVSYPTVWLWMRQGTFPRSRVVGGKSMWLSTDIEAWLASLPIRKLKGDAP